MIKPPYDWLMVGIVGIILFFVSVASIYSGKTYIRFGGWVYRTKEPGSFWANVIFLFLLAIGVIGYSLYKIYAFPN
jgi:hypothetical protein